MPRMGMGKSTALRPSSMGGMGSSRLEAFSDGVIAIIITIMVLELKVPHTADLDALKPILPVFLSYVLSFIYVGLYWNNHHHMLYLVRHVSGGILWANLHMLFWLSLFPFATGWMGENHFESLPTALYGFVLMMCAIAYSILHWSIVRRNGGRQSLLAVAVGGGYKEQLSVMLYAGGIVCAFFFRYVSLVFFVIVAAIWLIPDRRIERAVAEQAGDEQ